MSKVIVSPVERWSGTVSLYDPLTLPQVAAFLASTRAARDLGNEAYLAEYYNALMPGIYACVEDWKLKNFPGVSPETFPAKPRKDAMTLAAWLINELNSLVNEAEAEVPKASGAEPTPPPTDSKSTEEVSEATK